MRFCGELADLLANDPIRMEALRAVQSLDLPDCWIGAGFVRDAVWDHLHGYSSRPPSGDIDVVWFDAENQAAETDHDIEARLRRLAAGFDWSVKNQARMHRRNGDSPYLSVADAMRRWPETATAVAARLTGDDSVAISAPFGLDDLFAPRLTPTQAFATGKRAQFDKRVADKGWLERYPLLVSRQDYPGAPSNSRP
jgi:hypothetical protein